MAKSIRSADQGQRKMKTSQGNSKNTNYNKKCQKQNGKKKYRGQGK